MKIKHIGISAIAAMLCLSAVSCGNSSSSSSTVKSSEATSAATEKTSETVEAITADIISNENSNTPSDEILNAGFDSGYLQINGVLLRDGGYITVKDFIEKYGDKFDVSMLVDNSKKEIDKDWSFTYYIYYGDEQYGVDVSCAPPVSGSGTVEDAVIVKFSPNKGKADSTDHNEWYPQSVCKYLSENEDINYIKKLFEDNGLTYTEIDEKAKNDKSLGLEDKFPIKDNYGKYIISSSEVSQGTIINIIGAFQLSDKNLYGFKPVISCYYISEEKNRFRYLEVDYKEDGRVIQW